MSDEYEHKQTGHALHDLDVPPQEAEAVKGGFMDYTDDDCMNKAISVKPPRGVVWGGQA
jgi:hypothetical protein